jgi:hypothetical protein
VKIERPSASGLGKALVDPSVLWTPQAPKPPYVMRAAAKGHRIHAGIERRLLGARDGDVYACVTEEEEGELRQALDLLPRLKPVAPSWPAYEVECWLEPMAAVAARGIKAQCHHENPLPPPAGFYRGTADAIGLGPDGVLEVWDWKTGYPPIQTPPAFSAQLYFFAAWLAFNGRTGADVSKRGARLGVFLTAWAGRGREHAHVVHEADPASIRAFVEMLRDFELMLRAKESA